MHVNSRLLDLGFERSGIIRKVCRPVHRQVAPCRQSPWRVDMVDRRVCNYVVQVYRVGPSLCSQPPVVLSQRKTPRNQQRRSRGGGISLPFDLVILGAFAEQL